MERWRLAVGVQTWRNGGMEEWRRAVGVAAWRYERPEVWMHAAGYRYQGMIYRGALQMWRHAAL